MPTTFSNTVSCPHVFAHTRISPPSLHDFSNDWDTQWSNTIALPLQPRLLRDFYNLHNTVSWPGPSFGKSLPVTRLCAHRRHISAANEKMRHTIPRSTLLPNSQGGAVEKSASEFTPGLDGELAKLGYCITRVFDVDATTPNFDSLCPIVSLANRRGKTNERLDRTPLYTLLIDNVVSIRNYAAVVVVLESGCYVSIARPGGIHGCPKDGTASHSGQLWEILVRLRTNSALETQKR